MPSSFRDMGYTQLLGDREIETKLLALTKKRFHERVEPSLEQICVETCIVEACMGV